MADHIYNARVYDPNHTITVLPTRDVVEIIIQSPSLKAVHGHCWLLPAKAIDLANYLIVVANQILLPQHQSWRDDWM